MNKRTINALYSEAYRQTVNASDLRTYAEDIRSASLTGDGVLIAPENLRTVSRVLTHAADCDYRAKVTLQRARSWSH